MKKYLYAKFKEYYQFLKFCITGALNTIISLVCYFILIKIGINYLEASIISGLVGMVNSYTLNRKWVFKSNASIIKTSLKFCIVNSITISLSTFILYMLVHNGKLNKITAQLGTTIVVMVANYTFCRLWTFKKAN